MALPVQDAALPALHARVQRAIDWMGDDERRALALRLVDGRSWEEIGSELGVGRASVGALLLDARMLVAEFVRGQALAGDPEGDCYSARLVLCARLDGETLDFARRRLARDHTAGCADCQAARLALREADIALHAWAGRRPVTPRAATVAPLAPVAVPEPAAVPEPEAVPAGVTEVVEPAAPAAPVPPPARRRRPTPPPPRRRAPRDRRAGRERAARPAPDAGERRTRRPVLLVAGVAGLFLTGGLAMTVAGGDSGTARPAAATPAPTATPDPAAAAEAEKEARRRERAAARKARRERREARAERRRRREAARAAAPAATAVPTPAATATPQPTPRRRQAQTTPQPTPQSTPKPQATPKPTPAKPKPTPAPTKPPPDSQPSDPNGDIIPPY